MNLKYIILFISLEVIRLWQTDGQAELNPPELTRRPSLVSTILVTIKYKITTRKCYSGNNIDYEVWMFVNPSLS